MPNINVTVSVAYKGFLLGLGRCIQYLTGVILFLQSQAFIRSEILDRLMLASSLFILYLQQDRVKSFFAYEHNSFQIICKMQRQRIPVEGQPHGTDRSTPSNKHNGTVSSLSLTPNMELPFQCLYRLHEEAWYAHSNPGDVVS